MQQPATYAGPMGQFEAWCGKLFYYSGEFLGWRYIKELP